MSELVQNVGQYPYNPSTQQFVKNVMQGSPTSIIQGHVLRESQLSGANLKNTRFKLY